MSNQIEIGSGEDSHIDWAENFKVIDEIQLLLLDLESVEFPVEESTFHQVLNILELEPSDWQLFDGYFRAFDLLLNHPDISIESSLYDPDMPNSSIRQIIYVNESETKNLLQKLNEVRDIIKQYFDGNNVISLLKHAQSETISKEINQARLNKQNALIEAEEKFNRTLQKIGDAISRDDGIFCIEKCLIDAESKEIYFLSNHRNWGSIKREDELLISALSQNYQIHLLEEGISPELAKKVRHSSWGSSRPHYMGWGQEKSTLYGADDKILAKAVSIRARFNSMRKT